MHRLIKEKPSLLEIFSFVFFYPTALIGPSFEFSDFIKFIRLEKEYKQIRWASCNKEAFIQFIIGIICVTILITCDKSLNTAYCGTVEYENKPMLYKYLFMVISMIVLRSKYYVGWKLSQASVIFCGLGYDVKEIKIETPNHDNNSFNHESIVDSDKFIPIFDKIDNCNLTKIELHLNPRGRINYWNRTVHLWLKYYLFLRLINVKSKLFRNKSMASLLTFMVSACWHGFYPVYFFFFFEYYMIEQISKFLDEEYDLFNKIEKLPFILKLIYRIFLMSVMNYFGLCFTLLSLEENFIFSRAFYFVPFVSLFGSYIYTLFITIHHKKDKRRIDDGKKEMKKE